MYCLKLNLSNNIYMYNNFNRISGKWYRVIYESFNFYDNNFYYNNIIDNNSIRNDDVYNNWVFNNNSVVFDDNGRIRWVM